MNDMFVHQKQKNNRGVFTKGFLSARDVFTKSLAISKVPSARGRYQERERYQNFFFLSNGLDRVGIY
jgi:hypothetical protein